MKALKGLRIFTKRNSKSLWPINCVSHSLRWLLLSFTQLIPSYCSSFPQFTQLLPSDCNLSPRFKQLFPSVCNSCGPSIYPRFTYLGFTPSLGVQIIPLIYITCFVRLQLVPLIYTLTQELQSMRTSYVNWGTTVYQLVFGVGFVLFCMLIEKDSTISWLF